jgi:hypothetical protein
MRQAKFIGGAVLLLLFGTTTLGFAQQEQKGDKQDRPEKQAEPAQQKGQQQQQKPATQQRAQQQQENKNTQQHAQQQQQNQNRQQVQQQQQDKNTQQHAQQQQQDQNRQQAQQQRQSNNNQQITQRQSDRPVQQQRTQQQQIAQQGEQRGDWQQRRAHSFDTEHRNWQQRGGYNGYRIPDVYFSSYYGPGHSFRIYGLPFMEVGGFPRFQYGGYWFSVVDPYPEFWGDDWYESDDVFVAYIDNGYYLYDSRYPGRPGVAISISF